MSEKCSNCGKSIGGMFGGRLLDSETISEFKQLIECPDQICTNCDGSFRNAYLKAKELKQKARSVLTPVKVEPWFLAEKTKSIRIVSVDILPPCARYTLIDFVSFQSTLGTGVFSEIGSDISNLFGTESSGFNEKMSTSVEKCKAALRLMAYQKGANAVIGTSFVFSTNSRDATTVAAQGTAVFVENLDEVFRPVVDPSL